MKQPERKAMITENGEWIMQGTTLRDPKRVKTKEELVDRVRELGFLPLFANEVTGFSVEEQVYSGDWWSGDREKDPWEWREFIAAGHKVAYGKFFAGRAGFISPDWLPYFANARRAGYDFDARWQDGRASRREKKIMDFYMEDGPESEPVFHSEEILSTDLKLRAGFGKGGEKNFSGILTGLQMQTYLVIADFKRRQNRQGEAYGMAVSILLPPEAIWGYTKVTSAYGETPEASWDRIYARVRTLYPENEERDIVKVIGKRPSP